jgi:hypothetical protein
MTVPALVTTFIVLICSAWLMAVPPGSPPDEPAHYVKAIAAGRADFFGRPIAARPGDRQAFLEAGARDPANLEALLRVSRSRAFRWQQRTTRFFDLPSVLVAPSFGCTASQPKVTGACIDDPSAPVRPGPVGTYTGTYQPYVYVLPGLAMRWADGPDLAVRLGRAAMLALSAGLLVAAVWVLWAPSASTLSLLGFVVAVTPAVVFLSSVLSPSGPEIAGAICFSAALLRLARAGPASGWVWVALGVGGTLLAGTRALGPAFVLTDALLVASLAGPATLSRRLTAGGKRAAWAVGAVALAASASLLWEFTRQPRPRPTTESALDALGPSISGLPEIARQAVGVFGALDAPMPAIGYVLWDLLLVVIVGSALAVGTRRERVALVGLCAILISVILVMSLVYREIGPLHGRYALPVLVVLPLAAGEVVLRHRERLAASWRSALLAGSFVLAGAVHALGWWASARRFAVGVDGSWLFPPSAAWAPPLGWGPWLATAFLGIAALLSVAALVAAPLCGRATSA